MADGRERLLDEIVGGQVPSNAIANGSVVMGQAPGGAASSSSAAPPPQTTAETTTVMGRVMGASSSSAPATSSAGMVQVACGSCMTHNLVPAGTTMLKCGGCQAMLCAGQRPAMHVQCFHCKTTNLVNPGVVRLKCGACSTMMDVPGEEADFQRALRAQQKADAARSGVKPSGGPSKGV
eukprot:gb/GFBE01026750.1/.p1 GENE.gb/GFBE01026750.1/~~gb/GFBE01026750.1/.p1  ORF type:complete len:179 (+),score=34.10 gb/GFBE01026750.1/:1-537(+)